MCVRVMVAVVGVMLLASFTAFAGEVPSVRKDINEATAKDFMKVKGIGKKTAHRLIEARDAKGGFTSMNQLKDIKGIGKSTLDKLVCSFFVKAEGELECKKPVVKKVEADQKININTADIKELTKLKGMGKKKAAKIVEYRSEHGWYRSPHELTNIKGIGKKTVENLMPYLTVRVDINSARASQFEALGFANGDTIIKIREGKKGFKTIEEFGEIKGLDQKVLDSVKPILLVK
jgi:competence protein ComEA